MLWPLDPTMKVFLTSLVLRQREARRSPKVAAASGKRRIPCISAIRRGPRLRVVGGDEFDWRRRSSVWIPNAQVHPVRDQAATLEVGGSIANVGS